MKLIPCNKETALAFVAAVHRHLPDPPSIAGFVYVGAEHDGKLVGVAIGGGPIGRTSEPGVFEIHRVACVSDAPRGACSMLVGALRRAAGALGYSKAITSTLATESGASLRGAGWQQTTFLEARGGWDCEVRPRKPGACDNRDKIKWEVKL